MSSFRQSFAQARSAHAKAHFLVFPTMTAPHKVPALTAPDGFNYAWHLSNKYVQVVWHASNVPLSYFLSRLQLV